MTDPGDDDRPRRQIPEYRPDLDPNLGEELGEAAPIPLKSSGPAHYAAAERYAREAAACLPGDSRQAEALAAIGKIHATLAVASAAALHEEYADIRDWRAATGQEGR
jgi:hypothetical protein